MEKQSPENGNQELIDSVSESLSRKSKDSNEKSESSRHERAQRLYKQVMEQDNIEFAYVDENG